MSSIQSGSPLMMSAKRRPQEGISSESRRLLLPKWPRFPRVRASDLWSVAAMWMASALMAIFITPHTGYSSNTELLYYTTYNVTVGALVGLYLFDRRRDIGTLSCLVSGAFCILCGALINELLIEPSMFESGPISGEGLYYGLMDSLWPTGLFLLLRFAEQQRLYYARSTGAFPTADPPGDQEEVCVSARASRGVIHIRPKDILYMKAERDFTCVVCAGGEYFVSENLKSMLAKLSKFGILRTHKSFAVNMNRLDNLTRTDAHIGEHRVPVGRLYSYTAIETWRSRRGAASRP